MFALLLVFYFFAAISIWLGLLSLRSGLRFIRYLQSEIVKDQPEFTPFVTVFLPLRGVDDGLRENVVAIFRQDYPNFEIVFVTDRAIDVHITAIRKKLGEANWLVQTVRGVGYKLQESSENAE